jgi:trimethyllysine dioxygenase
VAADEGGATWLVDGFSVADAVMRQFPDTFHFFRTYRLPFHCIEAATYLEAHGVPFLVEEVNGRLRIRQFRFNNEDRAPLGPDVFGGSGRLLDEFYLKHLPRLIRTTRDAAFAFEVKLEPGTMLVVSNHRVMHGRREFRGPNRNLIGAYVDLDEFESRCRLHGLCPDLSAPLVH